VFVVLEGIEGSGKTTLLAGLEGGLREDGHAVVVTREPGGSRIGEAIRELFLSHSVALEPLTEAFLVNAARAQHVAEVIRPALAAGRIVLCDRFVDSTLAYQGYGRGVDLNQLHAICEVATGGLEPDLVLVMDMPVSVASARLHGRLEMMDRIESENDGFHARVRQGFLALAQTPRHRVLDATLPEKRLLDLALHEVRKQLSIEIS
jgi:dTMP kinase